MHTKFDIYGSADSDSTEYMLHHLVVFEWPHLVSFYFTILIPIFTLAYYCGSEDFHIDSSHGYHCRVADKKKFLSDIGSCK